MKTMVKPSSLIQNRWVEAVGILTICLLWLSNVDVATAGPIDCSQAGYSCSYQIEEKQIQKVDATFKFQARISQAKMPVGEANFPKIKVALRKGSEDLCTEEINNVKVRDSVLNLTIGENMSCQMDDYIAQNNDLSFQICIGDGKNCLTPVKLSTVPYAVKATFSQQAQEAHKANEAVQCNYAHRVTADKDLFVSKQIGKGYYDFHTPSSLGTLRIDLQSIPSNHGNGGYIQWTPVDPESSNLHICAKKVDTGDPAPLEDMLIHASRTSLLGAVVIEGHDKYAYSLDVHGDSKITGNQDVDKNQNVGADLDVMGHASIHTGATVENHLDVYNGADIYDLTYAHNALVVDEGATINGQTHCNNDLLVEQGAVIHNGANITEGATVYGGATVFGGETVNGQMHCENNLVVDEGAIIHLGATITEGATVQGGATVFGGETVHGRMHCENNLVVDEGAVIAQGANISGGASISEGALISGQTHCQDDLVVDQGATIKGGATITGGTTITGAATINGPATIAEGTTIKGQAHCQNDLVVEQGASITGGATIRDGLTVASGDIILTGNVGVGAETDDPKKTMTIYHDVNFMGVVNIPPDKLSQTVASAQTLVVPGGEKCEGSGARDGCDIVNNAAAIAINATQIKANGTAISNNATQMAANGAAISNNAAQISTNGAAISDNAIQIARNGSEISNNATQIENVRATAEGNATRITNNETAIKANKTDINKINASVTSINDSISNDQGRLTSLENNNTWIKSGSNAYYNGGNVGIGITNPASLLELGGRMKINSADAGMWLEAGDRDWFFGRNGSNLRFYNGGDRLTIEPDGNVGIGVSNPGYLLEVGGQIKINSSDSGVWFEAGDNDWFLGKQSDYFRLWYGRDMGADKLVVLPSGYVGIGTHPNDMLEVKGNGRFLSNGSSGQLLVGKNASEHFQFYVNDNHGYIDLEQDADDNTQHNIYIRNNASGDGQSNIILKAGNSTATLSSEHGLKTNGAFEAGNIKGTGDLDLSGKATVDFLVSAGVRSSESISILNKKSLNLSVDSGWYSWIIGPNNNNDLDVYYNSGGMHLTIASSNGWVGLGDSTPNSELDVEGTIKYNGLSQESDRRLKKEIQTIPDALETVANLRGVSYRWNDNERFDAKVHYGFIAQEVQEVIPEIVGQDGEYLDLSYMEVIPYLVEAIKVQKDEIDELKTSCQGPGNAMAIAMLAKRYDEQQQTIEELRQQIAQMKESKSNNPSAQANDKYEDQDKPWWRFW